MKNRKIYKFSGIGFILLGFITIFITEKDNIVGLIFLVAGIVLSIINAVMAYKEVGNKVDEATAKRDTLLLSEELNKLKTLKDEGFITDEEYNLKHQQLKYKFDNTKAKYINK